MSEIISTLSGYEAVSGGFEVLSALLRKSNAMAAKWQTRMQRRIELRRLLRSSPHLIADIGLDYDEAVIECRKAPWQA